MYCMTFVFWLAFLSATEPSILNKVFYAILECFVCIYGTGRGRWSANADFPPHWHVRQPRTLQNNTTGVISISAALSCCPQNGKLYSVMSSLNVYYVFELESAFGQTKKFVWETENIFCIELKSCIFCVCKYDVLYHSYRSWFVCSPHT